MIDVPLTGIEDLGTAEYVVRYMASISGMYTMQILSKMNLVAGGPVHVNVVASNLSASLSQVYFPSSYTCAKAQVCSSVSPNLAMQIALRDSFGNSALTNASDVRVSVTYSGSAARQAVVTPWSRDTHSYTDASIPSGFFSASYVATMSGAYTINVRVLAQNVGGGPFTVWLSGDNVIHSLTSQGSALTLASAGLSVPFTIQARDRFGNVLDDIHYGNVLVRAVDPDSTTQILARSVAVSPGTGATVALSLTRSGTYLLHLSLNGIGAKGNPFTLVVRPDVVSATHSIPTGSGSTGGVRTALASLVVALRDVYGNPALFKPIIVAGVLTSPSGTTSVMDVVIFDLAPYLYKVGAHHA